MRRAEPGQAEGGRLAEAAAGAGHEGAATRERVRSGVIVRPFAFAEAVAESRVAGDYAAIEQPVQAAVGCAHKDSLHKACVGVNGGVCDTRLLDH